MSGHRLLKLLTILIVVDHRINDIDQIRTHPSSVSIGGNHLLLLLVSIDFVNHPDKVTGAHFNLPGHSVSDMKITVVEKVFNPDPMIREQREKYYINKFQAKYKGMNRKNG